MNFPVRRKPAMEKGMLVKLFETAKKAAAAGEEQRCLEALNQLKQFPVKNDALAVVRVVKGLQILTKHPRKRIQASASDVMETWKGVLHKKPAKSCRISTDPVKPGSKSSVIKKVTKISSDSLKKADPTIADKNREKIRGIVVEALIKVADEVANGEDKNLLAIVGDCDPFLVAKEVEAEMFNKWGSCNCSQKAKWKYSAVKFNIKDPKNPDFRRKVLLGMLPPSNIVELTSEDMESEARQLEISKIRAKKLIESECDRMEATTDQFQCGKCKKTSAFVSRCRLAGLISR